MPISRETKLLNSICIILVLLTGVARLALYEKNITYNSLICVLFSVALLIWIWQLRKRLLQSSVRKSLIAAAIMMIFWIVIRTIKYDFLLSGHFTTRYAWYLYYIPMVFIALFMFLAALHIGRNYNRSISRWWNLLFVPAFILVIGILTNDLHQMAFRFHDGILAWNEDDIIRGPFYYGVMLWMTVLFLAILGIVFVRCAVPGKRNKIWVPMVPLAIGIIYTLFIVFNQDNIVTFMFKVPEVGCFIFAAFMESLILVHLFPSNDSYGDFCNASSIGAGIMDGEGVIHYKSEHSLPVGLEQVQKAQTEAVLLQDGNVSLKSHVIHGGFGYWTRNIAEINELNWKLADMGDVLAEENAMLDAENRIAENRVILEQHNKLYDSIAKCINPQLEKISQILDTLPQEEKAFEHRMKYACVLNAYVKRYSNFLLLSHQNKNIDSAELYLAILESLEYLRMYGVKAHIEYVGGDIFPSEKILIAYELFETALEMEISGMDAVLVNLNVSGDGIELHIEVNAPEKRFNQADMGDKISKLQGKLTIETEGQTEYISLFLPKGGGGR